MSYIMKTRYLPIGNRVYWVNGMNSGIYSDIAKKMINQVEVMLEYHSKLHLIRFDLHLYKLTENNELITKFNRILFRWLKQVYGLKRIGFIWCREMEKSKVQHYHYVLMLDGHKVRNPYSILPKIKDVWENQIQGFQYTPKNCYYNLYRNDYGSIQSAIWRISYLAKVKSKGCKLAQTKNYSTSRIICKYKSK